MPQAPIRCGGIDVAAGQRQLIDLPIPRHLHTGAVYRDNLPQILSVSAFLKPCGWRAPLHRWSLSIPLVEGSMRKALAQRGIPVIVCEAGEALRFDETAIQTGFEGVLALMRALGMLSGRRQSGRRPKLQTAGSSVWVGAPQSGILRTVACLGARVKKNGCGSFRTTFIEVKQPPSEDSDRYDYA